MTASLASAPRRRALRQGLRVTLLAMLMLLTPAGLVITHADDLPDQAREALQKGNEAVQQRQWILAGQQFKIATDLAASAPEVLLANARFRELKGGSDVLALAWYRGYLATVTDPKEREQIKARIAALEQRVSTTARGLIDKALSAASNLPANERSGVLTNIAMAQARIGDLSGALATASSARAAAGPNSYGDDPYGRVADTLADMGDLAAAEDVLRRVEQSKRSAAMRQIAWTLTYAKKFPEALSYASRCNGVDQVNAYSAIAKAQAEAKDKDGARSSLNSALSAVNYVDQNSRRGTLLGMVETAALAGEFDTARRLWADAIKLYKPNDPNEAYYLNSARWSWANALLRWDHVAEAEAMLPSVFPNNKNPSFDWYRKNLISGIQSAHQRQARALQEKYLALVKEGKIADADAALSREPLNQSTAIARMALAQAYIAKADNAAAHRHLEAAASVLSKSTVANFSGSYDFTQTRIQLADNYRSIGDFAAARRILDATAGTILKLPKPDDRKSPLEYLCQAYVRLASAIAATKDYAGAKLVAMEVVRLAGLTATPADRSSALDNLAGLDAKVGMASDLAAALPSLPAGSSKQKIVAALVSDYVATGQDAAALAMAARIEDVGSRKNALSSAISKRAADKNWSSALALAADPAVSGRLYPEIAAKMLTAGMAQEAIALEPKFTASSDEASSYYSSLAQYHAARGNADAAVAAAMRITSTESRIRTLLSGTSSLNATAGRAAARLVYDRGTAMFAELKTPAQHSQTCNAIDYYLRHGTFVDSEAPAQSDGSVPALACIAEALALPAQRDRLGALGNAISYNVTITRPLIGPLAPTRPAISRFLTEAASQSDVSARDGSLSYALLGLARDGAIESALQLGAANLSDVRRSGTAATTAAVTWLVEAGDTATAQRILGENVEAIAGVTDQSAKNSLYSNASSLAVLLGDYDRAIKLSSEIKSAGDRVSSFVGIANSANNRERFDIALNALDRAVAADKEAESHYYRSSFYSIAAQAGHKNAEAYLDYYLTDKSVTPGSRVSARGSVMTWLLKWKQVERVAALVPVQEAELEQLGSSERWSNAASFATTLATLGDTARLNKLFNEAPLPENKTSVLLSAAAGFQKAEKPDLVRAAIERALELSAAIPDPGTRSSTLQSIAGYQVRTGNVDAARKTYAQAIEVLKVKRPDLPGWIDFNVATDHNSVDATQATKLAQAIPDPFWRISALVRLAGSRASGKLDDALTLLRALPPSALADGQLETTARSLMAKHDFDTARELAARVSHAGIRDQLKRRILLAQARSGAVEAALADMGWIENKIIRAYTFIDLGAFLLTQKGEKAAQNAYFAQLCAFAAANLANQVTDPLIKSDLLADAGHGLDAWQQGAGAATLSRAVVVAAEIADARARQYAIQWTKGLDTAQQMPERPDPLASEAAGAMVSRARYYLTEDWFLDLDAHIESFASSNPGDRVSKLTNIATSLTNQTRELRNILAEIEKKRTAAK